MENKKYAPTNIIIMGIVSIVILNVLFALGFSSHNAFLSGAGFGGSVVLVIVLCNLAYKKGLENK